MNILKKVIIIILSITIVIGLLISIDVILISKYQKGPIFAIKTKTYHDGGTKEYCGIGYKVIKYHQKQGRRDIEIGTYKLKYNINPIDISALDLSIEYYNDKGKALSRYNGKFIRTNGILKEYSSKDNTITIGYIDEDNKYSIDIICNMVSDKRKLKKLSVYKDTTIIGTQTGYDAKTKEKPITIYVNGCFAEQ